MAQQNNTFLARTLERMLNRVPVDNPATPALPYELVWQVLGHLGLGAASQGPTSNATTSATRRVRHPALDPPRDGSSPFIDSPAEVRRAIFVGSMPAKDALVLPRCGDAADSRPKAKVTKRHDPQHNRTSDLMVLNKKICREIATIVYEERKFGIHVHEGIKKGGIEFLDVGRQPLQYQDSIADARFTKFKHGEAFGFDRIKNIKITIYPSEDGERLVSLNTFYMSLALARLLERSDGDEQQNRITSLTIDFASGVDGNAEGKNGRRAIMDAESYWWDANRGVPRATSVHGTSNVAFVLLPLSRLKSHNVKIDLPAKVRSHAGTMQFVARLEKTMTDNKTTDLMDDDFLHHLESAREAYEKHILHTRYGKRDRFDVPKLSEGELQEDTEDGYKQGLDLEGKAPAGDRKRRKSDEENHVAIHSDDEDEELQRALLESAEAARK